MYGHLDCFYVEAVICDALNILEHVIWLTYYAFLLGLYLRSGFLGHRVAIFLMLMLFEEIRKYQENKVVFYNLYFRKTELGIIFFNPW